VVVLIRWEAAADGGFDIPLFRKVRGGQTGLARTACQPFSVAYAAPQGATFPARTPQL